jgi:penicillin-binding protein 1A
MVLDAPATFNSGGTAYSPRNFDRKFEGNITLRHALAESRNVPAVRLAQRVGMATVAEYARRFGIASPIPPFLPVALGAADLTLIEQTSAFTVFPNDGIRIEPRYIRQVTDYEGHTLEEDFPDAKDVISSRTARTMVSLLQGVVQHGTGSAARKLGHPVAGKTGTTNDYTDAWFIGFTPSITCGVWIGFDEKKKLGENETGGHAALPIWIDFMGAVISDPSRKDEAFLAPADDRKKSAAVRRAAMTPLRHPGDTEAH